MVHVGHNLTLAEVGRHDVEERVDLGAVRHERRYGRVVTVVKVLRISLTSFTFRLYFGNRGGRGFHPVYANEPMNIH